MVTLLALTAVAVSASCPLEHSTYRLRDGPQITARFVRRAPTPGWPADVQLEIRSAKTGGVYVLLPYAGNGQGVITHLASVTDPAHPPAPDAARTRPIGDLDYMAADAGYRFDQGFRATAGAHAPAHILVPGLQEALWYRATKREGVPLAYFDLDGCR
jgi:hypothetical protein